MKRIGQEKLNFGASGLLMTERESWFLSKKTGFLCQTQARPRLGTSKVLLPPASNRTCVKAIIINLNQFSRPMSIISLRKDRKIFLLARELIRSGNPEGLERYTRVSDGRELMSVDLSIAIRSELPTVRIVAILSDGHHHQLTRPGCESALCSL